MNKICLAVILIAVMILGISGYCYAVGAELSVTQGDLQCEYRAPTGAENNTGIKQAAESGTPSASPPAPPSITSEEPANPPQYQFPPGWPTPPSKGPDETEEEYSKRYEEYIRELIDKGLWPPKVEGPSWWGKTWYEIKQIYWHYYHDVEVRTIIIPIPDDKYIDINKDGVITDYDAEYFHSCPNY